MEAEYLLALDSWMMAFKFALKGPWKEGKEGQLGRSKEDGPDTELETDEEMRWNLAGTQRAHHPCLWGKYLSLPQGSSKPQFRPNRQI